MHQQLKLPSSFSQLVLYLSGSAALLGGPVGKGKQAAVYLLADLSGSVGKKVKDEKHIETNKLNPCG